MALNIADLFEHAADVVPDRMAVACGDRHVTYRELDERTNRLAHHLASIGVGRDDHVGLYARNSIEAVEMLVATYKLRARAVNINYRYVEAELRYMVADADLVALVYDQQYAPLVAAVRAGRAQAARSRRHRRRLRPGRRHPRRRVRLRPGWPVTSPRLRRAQRRRHLHALHGRYDRLSQGRALAAGRCLAHPWRRHRLPHGRAAGRRMGAVAEGRGGRAGQALHGTADPRQRAVGDAHGPVRRRDDRACAQVRPEGRSGPRCSSTRSTSSSSSATRWPGR